VTRYALIAGNGRFPLLALRSARELGHEVVAVGIKEEASPEIEQLAAKCHWISLGELSRLIRILKEEGVRDLILAGQVKHASIFSAIQPDWRLVKVLASLEAKNTDSLIGGVIRVLESEGLRVMDSTALLKPLLASAGAMTRRRPTREEEADIAYGRRIANALAAFDVGQSVVIADRACVAAAAIARGRPLRLVKVSRRRAHLLFDVPVAGLDTIAVMRETGATVLAVDAGRTLLLDREEMLARADAAGIAIVGYEPAEDA